MKTLILIALVLALGACSAHSPFILTNTTEGKSATSAKKYQSHSKPVLVTQSGLPADIQYELVETVEVGKIWYGGSSSVDESMAARAREIGADAVILTKHWHQPSGFSWAAPHGSGQAVKILNVDPAAIKTIPGTWM